MKPANYQFKRLGPEDLPLMKQLIGLFKEVFELTERRIADEQRLTHLLAKPDFIIWVALSEGTIVGGLTAFELPMYYEQTDELFIYDIAVHPSYQRQGLGRRLLEELKTFGVSRGITCVFVDADVEDQHALDFYQSTGGEGAEVKQFSYELR